MNGLTKEPMGLTFGNSAISVFCCVVLCVGVPRQALGK